MDKSILGTEWMQMTGRHYQGINLKQDINTEDLEAANKKAEREQQEYVARLLDKDKDCKRYDNKRLVPVTNRVVVLPYERNPYRQPLRETNSGLIIGDFETGATYKSPDSGEEEAARKGIWCCEVIAVGPDCKSVTVGEDVYINFTLAAPIPFGGKGYYNIAENNILCSVRNNE